MKFLGVFFSLVFLISCGEKASQNHVMVNGVPVYTFASRSELLNAIKNWKVKCVDSTKCPSAVGQLVVTDGNKIGLCTATLVDEDVIMTNSHCFDLVDRSTNRYAGPENVCASGTSVIFPENSSGGAESAKCAKILKQSFVTTSLINPDYLILQLDRKLKRSFDSITRTGIEDKMKLQIRKVNPVRQGYGELEVTDCQARFGTILMPAATHSHFHIHTVTGCQVVHGNSGSSLVDSDGKIRGLMYSAVTDNNRTYTTDFERQFVQKALRAKTSLITNATCIRYDFKKTEALDDERCASYVGLRGEVTDLLSEEDLQASWGNRMLYDQQSVDSDPVFGYSQHFIPSTREYVYAPRCIRSSFVQKIRSGSLQQKLLAQRVF